MRQQPRVIGLRGLLPATRWQPSARVVLLAVALTIGVLLVLRAARMAVVIQQGAMVIGRWQRLQQVPTTYAQTSWVGVGFPDMPRYGYTPAGSPLMLAGKPYDTGIGTVPTTELVYDLDGRYAVFRATVGIDESSGSPESGARFLVVVDDTVGFDSGPLRFGDPVAHVAVPVVGAQSLRLLTAPLAEGQSPFANWVRAELLRPFIAAESALHSQLDGLAAGQQAVRAGLRQDAQQELAVLTAQAVEVLARALPGDATPAGRAIATVVPSDEIAARRLVLANQHLAVLYGIGGDDHASLTLVDRRNGRLLAQGVSSAIILNTRDNPRRIDLHRDTQPAPGEAVRLSEVDDPVLGPGQSASIFLRTVVDERPLQVRLTLLNDRPVVLWEIFIEPPRGLFGFGGQQVSFRLVDGAQGSWFIGDGAQYVTDFSRRRFAVVRDDGVERRAPVAVGAPVLLRGGDLAGGVLLAALDEHRRPAQWSVRRQPGQPGAQFTFQTDPAIERPAAPGFLASPRLYIEVAPTDRVEVVAAGYRRAMQRLQPAPALPAWWRYQWDSRDVHGLELTEATLRAQINFLVEQFGDLGPWSVVIDAGRRVAEGRDESGPRSVVETMFPGGLRALVDDARSRGVRTILSLWLPYFDDQPVSEALPNGGALVAQHPIWFTPLRGRDVRSGAALNIIQPAVRAYLGQVLDDYFLRYGVDGIKLDGIGRIGEDRQVRLDEFGLADPIVRQTMPIYRLIWQEARSRRSDAFVEAGWLAPQVAAPYVHTRRVADTAPQFSAPYPTAGLVEHIDYAALQRDLLGQRPHLGTVSGDPQAPVSRWFLGAALAMGAQVTLSLDLREAAPAVLAAYRGLLVPYRPFTGRTVLDQTLAPTVMATTRDDLTFLGLLNRHKQSRQMAVDLASYGLDPTTSYAAYDVEGDEFSRVQTTLQATVPAQSFRLFVLRHTPGVLWTSSSYQVEQRPGGIDITLRGPATVPGALAVVTDRPRQVLLDESILRPGDRPDSTAGTYRYDENTGVLHVRYAHEPARVLRIR